MYICFLFQAFPQGSPLVSYISRAILNVTEDTEKMEKIEKNIVGSQATCQGQIPSLSSSDSLSVYSFGGLFLITGIASMSSLLIYIFYFVRLHWPELNNNNPERSFRSKIVDLVKHFDQKDLSSHPLGRRNSSVYPESSPEGNGASPDSDDIQNQNHSRNSSEGAENVDRDENDGIHSSVHGDTSTDAPNTT